MTVVQGYEVRHGQTPLSPLVMWAAWAVESLHYLNDLDQARAAYPSSVGAHHSEEMLTHLQSPGHGGLHEASSVAEYSIDGTRSTYPVRRRPVFFSMGEGRSER
jgi:hypothetical protein